jgi:hypothetical protein
LATNGDTYFWTLDDLLEHLETDTPTREQLDELRLIICVPKKPRYFDLNDFLCDDLPDDCDPPGDWKAIEKVVNDYIKDNSPLCWHEGRYRVSVDSLLEAIQKEAKP